jgi:hypothetical protein
MWPEIDENFNLLDCKKISCLSLEELGIFARKNIERFYLFGMKMGGFRSETRKFRTRDPNPKHCLIVLYHFIF